MPALFGVRHSNGNTLSSHKPPPSPPSVYVPAHPIFSETPPTPDVTDHKEFGFNDGSNRPLSTSSSTRKSRPANGSAVPQSAPNAARQSLAPGRTSSENTAVSIFSMYTDEEGMIEEDPNEGVPSSSPSSRAPTPSHVQRLSSAQMSHRSRSASPKIVDRSPKVNGRRIEIPSVNGSLGPESLAAFLIMDTEDFTSSVSDHSSSRPAHISMPDSIELPYGSPPTRKSVLRESHSIPPHDAAPVSEEGQIRPSTSRSIPSSFTRVTTHMSPRASTDILSTSTPNTPATVYPPLPPSRSPSRLSRPNSARPSETSPRQSTHLPLSPPIQSSLAPPEASLQAQPSRSSLASHTQPPQHRGVDEEADAEYVRSVYAQFDSEGVPGDGWEDGLERTRARLSLPHLTDNPAPATPSGDLSANESKRLRSVDRYGFFIMPKTARQEARITALPSAPLSKKVRRLRASAPPVPASQKASPPETKSASTSQSERPPTHEFSRLTKWQAMMQPSHRDEGGNVDAWTASGRVFERRVWKGIPDRWRPATWQLLIDNFRYDRSKRRASHEQLAREYRDTVDAPSSHDVQIDLDVPRTVNDHLLFHTRYGHGQRALFHTLHCFSLKCSSCEYVQGMGPIAATLLLYFNTERAYSALVRIHDEYEMHTVFQPGFPGLLEAIYVQERLVEQLMPAVHKSFQKNMISSTSFVTKWYITLFANSFPFQTQLRIWDAFFLEGRDVIIVTAVAIIWVLKDYLAAPDASFETILSLLSSYFVPEDEDAFIDWIRVTLSSSEIRSAMTSWRRAWSQLVASGKHHDALL